MAVTLFDTDCNVSYCLSGKLNDSIQSTSGSRAKQYIKVCYVQESGAMRLSNHRHCPSSIHPYLTDPIKRQRGKPRTWFSDSTRNQESTQVCPSPRGSKMCASFFYKSSIDYFISLLHKHFWKLKADCVRVWYFAAASRCILITSRNYKNCTASKQQNNDCFKLPSFDAFFYQRFNKQILHFLLFWFGLSIQIFALKRETRWYKDSTLTTK